MKERADSIYWKSYLKYFIQHSFQYVFQLKNTWDRKLIFFFPFFFHTLILLGHRLERQATSETSWGSNHVKWPKKKKKAKTKNNPWPCYLLVLGILQIEFLENMRSRLALQSKVYLRVKNRDTERVLWLLILPFDQGEWAWY